MILAMTTLSGRIREAMEGAGLKPLQLANATGKTSGAVTYWINGAAKSLKAESAMRIQQATGYSASWLITGTGERLAKNAVAVARSEFSPSATELAMLFDLIPARDRIKRAKAFAGAMSAIVQALESVDTSEQVLDQKKRSV